MRVEPFLQDATGEYQDRGRDNVPPGYVWSMTDFLPRILGAQLRGRGGWDYISQSLGNVPVGLAYAPYPGAPALVAVTANNQAWDVPLAGPTATLIGSVGQMAQQNPIWYRSALYLPSVGGNFRKITRFAGFAITSHASNLSGAWKGTVYRDRLVLANDGSNSQRVGFAKPGDPTLPWDSLSYIDTSDFISGVEAMRSSILAFHYDFVEQIRGTIPPDSALSDPTGDMQLTSLWDRAGCLDARSIAKWQENVIFADERGVHITDGGIVRNLIEQGGMATPWRQAFEGWAFNAGDDLAGAVYGNYYICTISVAATGLKQTWICDLPKRSWCRWKNFASASYVATSGTNEQLVGTNSATNRIISLADCWEPNTSSAQVDGDGANVLPEVETAWRRVAGRVGLRRIFDVFLHYLANHTTTDQAGMVEISMVDQPEDTSYEVIGTFGEAPTSKRRKLLVARRVEGIAFRVRALLPHLDFRIHSVGASIEVEEEHRL
jgi:hypothetical protein